MAVTLNFPLSGGSKYNSTPIRLQFDRATTIRRPTLQPQVYLYVRCYTKA